MTDVRRLVSRAATAVRTAGGRLAGGRTRSEHFVPDADLASAIAAGDTPTVHHLIRYQWAVTALRGRPIERLLDVACGSGHGSDVLAGVLPDTEVIGVDLDARAVDRASARYRRPNLEFRAGDVQRWDATIGERPFDAIVSFDTIEHVAHREIMMMNVVNHLTDEGVLLLSTPCAGSTVDLEPSWRHHRIEYSAAALNDLVQRYFGVVRRPDDDTLPGLEVFDQLRGSGVTYALRMNPLMCLEPIRVTPPRRRRAADPTSTA